MEHAPMDVWGACVHAVTYLEEGIVDAGSEAACPVQPDRLVATRVLRWPVM